MRKTAVVLVTTAMALILGGLATSCTPKTISPTDLSDASQIFSNDCASCHGQDRTGGHGPDITPSSLVDLSQSSLAAFLTDHKTAGKLTAEQQSILAAWLKNS
ncbi:hypothetical protein Dform_01162 [Dehalogenimonas formicexedens]|uniref:Cytochrome c domain-containing protein n=1 Tax=Dehalogenimonas formicexedens TaxID=1839801 RepID=A0A1P8F7S6_9CHLR|nr:cytochrome c [Dehalogenimonas formicexedens]APV44495.1 hypothetical protein Dform_01162 [Dehalogenimonas formicexedens]